MKKNTNIKISYEGKNTFLSLLIKKKIIELFLFTYLIYIYPIIIITKFKMRRSSNKLAQNVGYSKGSKKYVPTLEETNLILNYFLHNNFQVHE
jgi:hypothetical protein